jgi:hypothetical protein
MGCASPSNRCAASALAMASALAVSGCSSSKTSGLLGRMSKFDITTASPDDIEKALKEDGHVAISGGILFETDSAKLAPSAADVVTRIADMMKKDPNLKLAVVGRTDNTGGFNYNLFAQRCAQAMVDALRRDGIAADRLPGSVSGRSARLRPTIRSRGARRTGAWSSS